jgi:uncharacterized protein YegP (UPF0339 family)
MATATKKTRTAPQVAGRTAAVSKPDAMEFVVFEDNSGDYRWTILGGGGESLTQSRSFATFDDAQHAARVVRDGTGRLDEGGGR